MHLYPASSTGGNFFQGQMIFGNDSPGGGTNDWCFTYGGTGNQSVFGSIGRVGGDSAFQTGSLVLTLIGFGLLTAGGTMGGSITYVHGMRVLNLVDEPTRRAIVPSAHDEKERASE